MRFIRARSASPALPFVIVMGGLLLAYNVVDPQATVAEAVLYCAFAPGAAVALLLGARLGRHERAWPWLLLAAAMGLWTLGDIVWSVQDVRGGAPYPSIADASYLVGYLSIGAGLLGITMAGRARREVLADLIDVSMISLCVGLLAWPFVFEPMIVDSWSSSAAFSVFYGGADTLIVGLLAALVFNGAKRTRASMLLGLSVLAVFIADVMYYVPTFASHSSVDIWSSDAWLAGYVLLGAAGLHGSGRRSAESRSRRRSPVWRLAFVGPALLALPGSLVSDALLGDGFSNDDWPVFAVAFLVAIVLIFSRAVLLVRELEDSRIRNHRMRRRLQTVFECAGLGIVIGDGISMSETNSAFRAMLGYTEEELAQLRYVDLVHPDEVLEAKTAFSSPGAEKTTVERRYIHRDGSVVLGRVTHTIAPGDRLHIGVVEDITLKVQQEKERQEGQKLEAIGRLAGGIAHDFNNLLTAVSGHAELIRYAQSPEEIDESARVIVDASGRAADLTRQLLAFSRQHDFAAEEIHMPELVRRNVDLLRRVLPASVEVELAVDDHAPSVFADPTQVDQVLLNLSLNARDAMPEGGVLSLSVKHFSPSSADPRHASIDPGSYCRITVSDTGVGMASSTIDRIFEPFFTTKEVGKGTGLGLATAHGIVTQAGGHLLVSSEPSFGTTFDVLLPAVEAHPRPAAVRPETNGVPAAAAAL
jgi:PAS domain S-box-containing protein